MSEELKPCPFCGDKAFITPLGRISKNREMVIRCNGCSAIGPMYLNEQAMIKAWNTRQPFTTYNYIKPFIEDTP